MKSRSRDGLAAKGLLYHALRVHAVVSNNNIASPPLHDLNITAFSANKLNHCYRARLADNCFDQTQL